MRNWIDIITETLMEKVFYKVDIDHNEVTILENPNRAEMLRYVNDKNIGYFRGFLTESGNIFIFDAYKATHQKIGLATGLTGRHFEIRGKGQNVCTMLYITQYEWANHKEEWRNNPKIRRLFADENFHIGALRW